MSVVYFKEIHRGRGGGTFLQGKWRTITEHARVFLVKTSAVTDDETTILANENCPEVGDVHPTDSYSYCISVVPRNEDDSKLIWLVTAEYTSDRQLEVNPCLEPAVITWSTQSGKRLVFVDKSGYGIVNSAGDPYDPLPECDDSRWCCCVVKNVEFIPTWVLTYRDAVNSDAIVLDGVAVAAGYAKIMDLQIGPTERRSIFTYRTLSLTIALDSAGWALKVLDCGYRRKVYGDATKREKCSDGEGAAAGGGVNPAGGPCTGPMPLNGSGYQLIDPSPSTVVFSTHNVYNSLPFSLLPLS